MDRADLERTRRDEFGELAALRSGKGEVQPVRDTALEHGEMIGQRQHRLHHVQIVHPRRIDLRQGRREKIGLLLIVAFDRDAVAGLDDSFKQRRRAIGAGRFFRSPQTRRARASERRGLSISGLVV